jgi:hypothetical protein
MMVVVFDFAHESFKEQAFPEGAEQSFQDVSLGNRTVIEHASMRPSSFYKFRDTPRDKEWSIFLTVS